MSLLVLALKLNVVNDFSTIIAFVNAFSTPVNVFPKDIAPVSLQMAGYRVLETRGPVEPVIGARTTSTSGPFCSLTATFACGRM